MSTESVRIDGASALVTCASDRIGRAIAERLAVVFRLPFIHRL